MKFIAQTKFWQLPFSLKMVVIWFLGLVFNHFWQVFDLFAVKHILDLGHLIWGFVEFGLAVGIINKSNESRSWAAFFVFLGCLVLLFLLAITISKDPGSIEGFNITYEKFTRPQTIVFLVAYIIVNTGILFVLLGAKTRALFSEKPEPYIHDNMKEDVNINP